MNLSVAQLCMLGATLGFARVAMCEPPTAGVPTRSGDSLATPTVIAVVDQPLDAFRGDLLQVAFDAASAMPIKPHIRNRSRAQEVVVQACFTLDQPQLALGYVEKIDNWLRGSGYADYAMYCAERGSTADVNRYLELAAGMVQREEDWRQAIVKSKIARTYLWLGQPEKAASLEAGVVQSEVGKVNIARAALTDDAGFESLMVALSADAGSMNFDALRNAADAYLLLINRFYGDQGRHTLVEQRLRIAWDQLPTLVRVELMTSLAKAAIDHNDHTHALAVINEAQANIDGRKWLANDRLPLEARLAGLRWRAGEQERARRDLDALLANFDAERARITDIYRAETLCPIAEGYCAMGDLPAAMRVYRLAIEEGMVNPNSRPRADDLVGSCCSMAMFGVEPDAELWKRIRQIREGLSDPW